MTAPPGPGRSPPPLVQVGWIRSASSTAVTPPSLMPGAGHRARVRRQPVDVVQGEAGVGDCGQAGVHGQRQRVDHEPATHAGAADAGQHRLVLEAVAGRRGAGHEGLRRLDRVRPVRLTRGREQRKPDVPLLLEAHRHLLADMHLVGLAVDDVGRQPDARVLFERHHGDDVRRREVRVPLLEVDGEPGNRGPARHLSRCPGAAAAGGQIGTGGCTSVAQSWQAWMRSRPSSPERQNHSFAGVISGIGRTRRSFSLVVSHRPSEGLRGLAPNSTSMLKCGGQTRQVPLSAVPGAATAFCAAQRNDGALQS